MATETAAARDARGGPARRRDARRALAALALSAAGGHAEAGAWTRPAGETFASLSASYYETDPEPGYQEATVSLFAEYGLRETLTLGGQLEWKRPVGDSAPLDGEVTLSGFARQRLHVGAAGDPVSAQIGFEIPTEEDGLPPETSGDPALDLRLLYGRGFATPFGDAFLDLQGAIRLRLGEDADELRLDATAGLRPAPRWIALIQSFNTIGLANADAGGEDYDVYKIAPSVGYEIAPDVTLLIGVEREVAGRNIDTGTRGRIAVWTTF